MMKQQGQKRSSIIFAIILTVIAAAGLIYNLAEDPDVAGAAEGALTLDATGMMVMLYIGILVIAACLIFVKQDPTISYKSLDKISVLLNFVVGIAVIPFLTLVAALVQAFKVGPEWIYQMDLCIPAITALSVAASLSLRRRGYTKPGFFVQLTGPVLFVLLLIVETISVSFR